MLTWYNEEWGASSGGGLLLFQAEDGIRDLVRSRGLGDVYKRQRRCIPNDAVSHLRICARSRLVRSPKFPSNTHRRPCLLYTSDAADERSSVDLGGRRIIKKKNKHVTDRTMINIPYKPILNNTLIVFTHNNKTKTTL